MRVPTLVIILLLAAPRALAVDDMTVRVEPSNPQGTRLLQKQTADSAVRDYLQSWRSLNAAFGQNRPDLLEQSFVGAALDKLKDTIAQQAALGLGTRYQDRAHDLRIDFYSPDGLSIRLTDDVDYDQQAFDHGKTLATQRVHRRYVVVLTPTEVRWRVRVFQADPQAPAVAITKRVR